MDKDREFHELLGLCWHKEISNTDFPFECSCGSPYCDRINPDYAADTRLVFVEMRKREDFPEFLVSLDVQTDPLNFIDRYVLDETGLLCDAAIEFMRRSHERT